MGKESTNAGASAGAPREPQRISDVKLSYQEQLQWVTRELHARTAELTELRKELAGLQSANEELKHQFVEARTETSTCSKLFAAVARAFARVGARRRAELIRHRLRESVSRVASEHIVAPVREVLRRHAAAREQLDRARA
jgi:septal ring factor EnvC (AmiA/AmiB activator)